MGKIIGVVSLKGGVGKTSTVVAIGAALAQLGQRVLLIDGNLSAPNLGLHVKLIPQKNTLQDVLSGSSNLSDSIYALDEFDVIPADMYSRKRVNPLFLKNKIRHLRRKYDFIIIDSSPSLGEETLGAMLASDEILVVTTPDHPTLSTTLKSVKAAKRRGTPITGLILNKVYGERFEVKLPDVENFAEVPVMAVIPHDVNVLKSLAKLTPFPFYKPRSKGAREFLRLAETLAGTKDRQFNLKRWLKLTPKRPEINREVYYQSMFK